MMTSHKSKWSKSFVVPLACKSSTTFPLYDFLKYLQFLVFKVDFSLVLSDASNQLKKVSFSGSFKQLTKRAVK